MGDQRLSPTPVLTNTTISFCCIPMLILRGNKSVGGSGFNPTPESAGRRTITRRGSRILVRGAQRSFDPNGGGSLSPKFAQKLHDFKKSWGQGGAGPPGPPRSATDHTWCGFWFELSSVRESSFSVHFRSEDNP